MLVYQDNTVIIPILDFRSRFQRTSKKDVYRDNKSGHMFKWDGWTDNHATHIRMTKHERRSQ